ncbi:putative nuclear polyadenylated RNA-binding protein Nab2/ZC3H14 [Helianthus annuus]|nr:putative nuclear polyadenylated RNA-binding protein Nab2/ZC3H14 [Helianthus annuus]
MFGKGLMDSTDDLSFKIIFSGDGAGRLRDRVKEKLKEFMGDYTDDTLVEYVIVLLKNGRRKEEARNELNVFLGDDSDSFVSWLWDHLRSNLDLYAQSKESPPDEAAKQKPHVRSESEMIDSDKVSKNRRSKDWKGIIRDLDEPPPLRSAIISNISSEDDKNQIKRSPSPQPLIHRKRGRSGERGHTELKSQVEREAVSKSRLSASRRLLQFAVRDAVATSRPPGLTSEPSFKRLRSVVSTPTDDSPLEERRPLVSRVSKPMAVATKAVVDAAEDVAKVKPSGNVFDRLGRSADTSDQFVQDNGKHEVFSRVTEATASTYLTQYVDNDSMMLNYNVANVVDETSYKPHRNHNTSVATANSSHKTVNIYSNVNKTRAVSDTSGPKPVHTGLGAGNNTNGNGVPAIHAQREVQKTLPSTGVNPVARPTEDADSRTIFVNNVHFAATKDGLSRHFNKFGEVLKVLIVTEAATGQPKGSAYVEFMTKEAAENALSLDGTSFMSRILKVVRKSSAQQEAAAPVTSWPRVARASASRFGRGVPFPRGIGGIYRSRLPIKGGARSFQWKRDAQNSPSSDTIPSPSGVATASTPRSLTYVRTEATKTHENSSNAA